MNISLPPELARFVHERVESGLYASASEVVREGLRMLAAGTTDHPEADESELAAQQRAALDALLEEIDALPEAPPDDGLSGSRDHDRILYGPPG